MFQGQGYWKHRVMRVGGKDPSVSGLVLAIEVPDLRPHPVKVRGKWSESERNSRPSPEIEDFWCANESQSDSLTP
ncbi:hypothetical protein BRC84_05595 [Halobacteriales archaeon QS_1_68_44]|nr:MAG: hypothetical protein BRC84_05595 [Halobacteriales archaeon QS_1_68_44]